MNNLHFKVGLIAFLFPVLLLAQTPAPDRSGAGGNVPGSLAEEWFLLNGTNEPAKIPDQVIDAETGETLYRTSDNRFLPRNTTFIPDTNYRLPRKDPDESFLTNNPLSRLFPPGMFKDQTTPLGLLLNQLFYAGLAVAVILAVVMIIVGGVQYMTIDAAAQKDTGKKRVQAALGGLVLAFSAILILNTINPNLTKLSLIFEEIKAPSSTTTDGLPVTSGSRPGIIPQGNSGSWSEAGSDQWVQVLSNGTRSTDGRLVVSVYSATGDAVTDTNTAAKRGNMNNLLREGSVALSPDLIEKYSPAHGSEIFINGVSIGFYEDTTAPVYNGVQFKNTVDIYDENNSLGTKNILKNIPPGEWNMTFGTPRAQISNP